MMTYIELSYGQVALTVLLILINASISAWLGLGIERTLLIASVRTVVQLGLVGLVLRWVFEQKEWYIVIALLIMMTLMAAHAAVGRTRRKYTGIYLNSLAAVVAGSWLCGLFALTLVVRPEPWYLPQYSIPILGLVLGNSLTGVSLGLDRTTEDLSTRRNEVETLLALGASRWEAAREVLKGAVRTGMVPVINSMMVVGIVSLPGVMTGQILAGVDPLEAVQYQIVMMFLIAGATAIGTITVVFLSHRRLFNSRHQLIQRNT